MPQSFLCAVPLKHFELKLCGLKNSFAKLRLYVRYLHWVEQTYPSLSHSPDLENLLFRCVRDAAQLPQVQNDEDFVNMWIRLASLFYVRIRCFLMDMHTIFSFDLLPLRLSVDEYSQFVLPQTM
ncbi:hypothetical protein AHF37_09728 [Paragonimus kellicotti]|nr:hypothetical protein AHF37_09728 [Paragonimus kellicotti]